MVDNFSSCATEDLSVQPNGAYSYQEGCNGSPSIFGNIFEETTRVIELEDESLPYTHWSADCTTRNPAGGFFSVLDFSYGSIMHLIEISEDVTNTSGCRILETTPTINEAEAESNETFSFSYCAMAASPSGRIYYQTFSQLWVFTPVFD